MNYIAFFDENGNRTTSFVEGIHFTSDNKDEIIKKYEQENNCTSMEISDDEQTLLVAGTHKLHDGVITPVKEIPKSEEEEEREIEYLTNNKAKEITKIDTEELIIELMEQNELMAERLDALENKSN